MANLSRRRFLQTTTAAAVGAAAIPALGEAAQPRQPADPYGGFIVGVQSYSYRQFNLEKALGEIQNLGLRYVELYRGHVPTNATDAQMKAVRGLLEKHRI